MGNGSMGRGVYLTPLVLLPYLDESGEVAKVSIPISTSREWLNWAKHRSRFLGRKPEGVAAIVVDIPGRFYPVQINLISMSEEYKKSIEAIWDTVNKGVSGVSMPDLEDRVCFSEYLKNPIGNWAFRLMVADRKAMGKLVNVFRESGGILWGCDLQVVVVAHLPSSCIKKVVPLYRTNKAFSIKRHGRRRSNPGE